MTISKILVPVRGDGKGETVLEHAVALARLFAAHIETLYCQAQTADVIPYGVVVPRFLRKQIESSMNEVGQSESERMRALFDDFGRRHGLTVVGTDAVPPAGEVSLRWRTALGRQADLLGLHGRLSDLIAVPRPDHEQNLGFNTLHAALMYTGRPVMMCADTPPERPLLEHVAIAWNGSTEASRAVALGMDLVQKADRVTVMTAGETPEAASAADLVAYLAVRGVEAERRLLAPGDPGQRLLATASELGATLMLMGAYSHSRGRESLFGGVTQHIVDEAKLPTVLVH